MKFNPIKNVRPKASTLRSERLEDRRLLAVATHDFEAQGASQFGPGDAVAVEREEFVGFDFDTKNFGLDVFDDITQTGIDFDLRLFGKAGLELGYVINSGSVDAYYDDVQLDYSHEFRNGQLNVNVSKSFTQSENSHFTTTSPTVGGFADLVLDVSSQGQFTGKLFGIGGTLDLSGKIADIDQELIAFNRNDDRQIRLLGESVLASQGVSIEIPLGKPVGKYAIKLVGSPLDADSRDARIGLEAEANLVFDKKVPKAIKKQIDKTGVEIPSIDIGVKLAEMQVAIPNVRVASNGLNVNGVMSAATDRNDLIEDRLARQLAAIDLSLGLEDIAFQAGSVSLKLTPIVFNVGPEMFVEQNAFITPQSLITYEFDRLVSGNKNGQPFSGRSMSFHPSDDIQIDFDGSPIGVTPKWNFKAELNNQFTIETRLSGELTVGGIKFDIADAPKWLRNLLQLPISEQIYKEDIFEVLNVDTNNLLPPIELFHKSFTIIDETIDLEPFTISTDDISLEVKSFDEQGESLRNAIKNAELIDSPVITLGAGTFELSNSPSDSDSNADLDIRKGHLTIVGQGADKTMIDANSLSRVFDVHSGATLTLEGVTITGGMATNGGGIKNAGWLNLIDVIVDENTSSGIGGGIDTTGPVNMTGSTVRGNSAATVGGGINVSGANGTLELTRTTFTGNWADHGGGINVQSNAEAFVSQSTFVNNKAVAESIFAKTGQGGGVRSISNGFVELISSTISSNEAADGGGIFVDADSEADIFSTTIAENIAIRGGGVFSDSRMVIFPPQEIYADVLFGNSIVADNQRLNPLDDLRFRNTYGSYSTTGNNLIGINSPGLSALDDHGGPTKTYLLLPNSPAIGWGTRNDLDQRGFFVPNFKDRRDIGATQFVSTPWVIDAIRSNFEPDLRDALAILKQQGGEQVIILGEGTHLLSKTGQFDENDQGDLDISNRTVTIRGPGAGKPAVIDGSLFGDRVFDVNVNANLTLEDVTVTGGHASRSGGAIRNFGTLNLTRANIVDNIAEKRGGGIFTYGTTTVVESNIEANRAQWGGGIANVGDTSIDSSLLANNTAKGSPGAIGVNGAGAGGGGAGLGGGIYNDGTLNITNSTLSANEAIGGRGGNSSNAKLIPPILDLTANEGGKGGGLNGGEGGDVGKLDILCRDLQISDIPVIGDLVNEAVTSAVCALANTLDYAATFNDGENGSFGSGGGGASGDRDPIVITREIGEEFGFDMVAKDGGDGAFGGGGGGGGAGQDSQVSYSLSFCEFIPNEFQELFTCNATNHYYNSGNGGNGGIFAGNGAPSINRSVGGPGGGGAGIGGGIFHSTGDLTIRSITVHKNVAKGGEAGIAVTGEPAFAESGQGITGGIYNYSGNVSLQNSVVAGNESNAITAEELESSDLSGEFTSLGHNFIGVAALGDFSSLNGDQFGIVNFQEPLPGEEIDISDNVLDAKLGPLQDNGGSTRTHVPQLDSLLVDMGQTTLVVDQRGLLRPIGFDVDMGATENQTIFVNSEIDSTGERSLRRAIIEANQLVGRNEIKLEEGTFVLTKPDASDDTSESGDLDVLDSLVITGAGVGRTILDASQLGDRVFDVFGKLEIAGLTILGGKLTDENGGAIRVNSDGELVISNSHLLGGEASHGGAIANYGLTSIFHSAFTNNHADDDGGAIYSTSSLFIEGSTLSGNSAHRGGAIFIEQHDSTSLQHVTIADNTAHNSGGAVFADATSSGVEVSNSIFVENDSPDADLVGVAAALDINLVEDTRAAAGLTSLRSAEFQLPNYGLLPFSPAVDASMVSSHLQDQLGRPRILGTHADFGAIEQTFFEVGVSNDGLVPKTLRYAVLQANQLLGEDTITFSSDLNGIPIRLTDGELEISDSLQISGNGAQKTLIDAESNSRIFGVTSAAEDLTVGRMTLKNGRTHLANSKGGAILFTSPGTLTIRESQFQSNSTLKSDSAGGAVAALAGTVDVIGSTFSNNSTAGSFSGGGAIYAAAELAPVRVDITNSTLSGNQTEGSSSGGAAIFIRGGFQNEASLNIANSTIVRNHSVASVRGGINMGSGPLSTLIENSIVAENTALGQLKDLSHPPNKMANSLVGINLTESGSLIPSPVGQPDANGNMIGSSNEPIEPMLTDLLDNGGPTVTHALLPDSPAIDTGANTDSTPFDQRGTPFVRHFGLAMDIGSVEFQDAPPTVNSVVIDDGSAQRSMVRSLRVNFDRRVKIEEGAFVITNTTTSTNYIPNVVTSVQAGKTVATLTFEGYGWAGNSIIDGNYELLIHQDKILVGDATMEANYIDRFYRLLGDQDGDRDVDARDFRGFRKTYRKSTIDEVFNAAYDFDGDGDVDARDFREFRRRYRMVLDPNV